MGTNQSIAAPLSARQKTLWTDVGEDPVLCFSTDVLIKSYREYGCYLASHLCILGKIASRFQI